MRRQRPVFTGGVPQQTGVLFTISQQVQPLAIMHDRHSQHAWIILQQSASPEVQVTQQPSLVISHLHRPIVRLQQQTIIPLSMQQQEHMPPWSDMQRFCIMLHAIGSSQLQVIFIPPVHFSTFMVHRGTMRKLGVVGMPVVVPTAGGAMPGTPMAGIAMAVRSTIIALAIVVLLSPIAGPPVHRASPGHRADDYTVQGNGCNDFVDSADLAGGNLSGTATAATPGSYHDFDTVGQLFFAW